MTWTGLVLTGGGSTRMGRDKATLEVGGVAMAQRVAQAMVGAGATTILAIGGAKAALEPMGLEYVEDQWPGEGPLGAIVTGLEHVRHEISCYAPCDLAVPAASTFTTLITALAATDEADLSLPLADGVQRPAPAALRTSARSALEAAFQAGERSVHRAFRRLRIVTAALDQTAIDDADSPADLKRLFG